MTDWLNKEIERLKIKDAELNQKAEVFGTGRYFVVKVGVHTIASFDAMSDDYAWSNARRFAQRWNSR